MAAALEHVPVLLAEAIEGLRVEESGVYLDGTFGRGGHSEAILGQLGPAGCLYAIDRDRDAIEAARQRFADEPRFAIRHGSFSELDQHCDAWGVAGQLDGILLDIGVSSPQLDDPERGFSFQFGGPLDMRMDQSRGQTAAEWLESAEEGEIVRVLREYGEERNARRIARAVKTRLAESPIETTRDLVAVVESATRVRDRHKHPATRTFQALRIEINGELRELERGLEAAVQMLAPGGRLAVISFHSLEDRAVKRFIRRESQPREIARGLPLETGHIRLRACSKAIKAGEEELARNPRARSAVLRLAERVA
ncbi:MAG: 16S rRNA (cytosine(1402)-N(4))-methyltransferase RsmH [Pseudomonadota bacterium]